jgi:hypothetical protein
VDSSGLHMDSTQITVFGKDYLWYAFRVRFRVFLRFSFRFGVRVRFKVLKERCVCVCI